jgi:hypothetical protein
LRRGGVGVEKAEAAVDAETLARVREMNKYDLELYAFGQELVKARIERTLLAATRPEAEANNTTTTTMAAPLECLPLPAIPTTKAFGTPYTAEKPRRPFWSLPLCMYLGAERRQHTQQFKTAKRRKNMNK